MDLASSDCWRSRGTTEDRVAPLIAGSAGGLSSFASGGLAVLQRAPSASTCRLLRKTPECHENTHRCHDLNIARFYESFWRPESSLRSSQPRPFSNGMAPSSFGNGSNRTIPSGATFWRFLYRRHLPQPHEQLFVFCCKYSGSRGYLWDRDSRCFRFWHFLDKLWPSARLGLPRCWLIRRQRHPYNFRRWIGFQRSLRYR